MALGHWSQIKPYLARIARHSHSPLNTAFGIATILRLPQTVRYQPELVKVETTTRCNLACQFCGHTWAVAWGQGQTDLPVGGEGERAFLQACRRSGRDMPLETFQRILAQFPRMSRLDVQGIGEPLINPGFMTMLEQSAAQKARAQFYTNGILMSPGVSKRLVELQVTEITISVDGASPSVYEFIRRGARFDRVVSNVQSLVEAKRRLASQLPYVRLAMVVTAHNVAEMPGLVALGHRLGVDHVIATRFKDISPALVGWVCDEAEIVEAVRESSDRAKELGIAFSAEFALPEDTDRAPKKRGPSSRRCLWPWLSVNVTIDGYLTPCSYVPRPEGWGLGNLLETPFSELWNAPAYKALREGLRSDNASGLVCESCRDQV